MWPRPPRPTTARLLPGPAFQWRSGEYVLIPAHSSCAAASSSIPSGMNAVADGMNLVAKEAAVVNQRDGVLVLSENTGARQELGEHVTVYPYDIRQHADAPRGDLHGDKRTRRRGCGRRPT